MYLTKKRQCHSIISEFIKKPPSSQKCENGNSRHLHTSTHSFLSSNIFHIEIVIESTENTHRKYRKKRKKCLRTFPEAKSYIYIKVLLIIFCQNRDNYYQSKNNQNHSSSHIWSSLFMHMERMVTCRMSSSHGCLSAYLFRNTKITKKVYIIRCD